MKVAISSASFAGQLAGGQLTQLEWLEACASGLGADGVVFARDHFARTDAQYIAQLKKVSVDLGLVPVAVAEPVLFDARRPEVERLLAIEIAAGIGALFVLATLPQPGDVPPATFVATVLAAKLAVKAAKGVNVTILAQPEAGTLAEDAAALRHFLKDVDSAWLRFALPGGMDRSALASRDRTLLVTLGPTADSGQLDEVTDGARPWLLLTGEVDAGRINRLRQTAAQKTLAISGAL